MRMCRCFFVPITAIIELMGGRVVRLPLCEWSVQGSPRDSTPFPDALMHATSPARPLVVPPPSPPAVPRLQSVNSVSVEQSSATPTAYAMQGSCSSVTSYQCICPCHNSCGYSHEGSIEGKSLVRREAAAMKREMDELRSRHAEVRSTRATLCMLACVGDFKRLCTYYLLSASLCSLLMS